MSLVARLRNGPPHRCRSPFITEYGTAAVFPLFCSGLNRYYFVRFPRIFTHVRTLFFFSLGVFLLLSLLVRRRNFVFLCPHSCAFDIRPVTERFRARYNNYPQLDDTDFSRSVTIAIAVVR